MAHVSHDSPAPDEPLSLAEHAHAEQCRWTVEYVSAHRAKRSASWTFVVLLATYVATMVFKLDPDGPFIQRIMMGVTGGAVPLLCICFATVDRLRVRSGVGDWVGAWVILACDALLGVGLFKPGSYITGMAYLAAVIAFGAVPAYGLHIPLDPKIDWDKVWREDLTYVRTFRGGRTYKKVIYDYRQAEEIAASWLRRFGYKDAHRTPDGRDNGIDVESLGAVAQVKNWLTKRVGIADVQRLAGSAKRGQASFFFAASGYTNAAVHWAMNPDNRVGLFILRSDGNIIACNYHAKKAIWLTHFHLPAELRRAPRRSDAVTIIVSSVVLGLNSLLFTTVAIYSIVTHSTPIASLGLSVIAGCMVVAFTSTAPRSIRRLICEFRRCRKIDIIKAFTPTVSDRDKGLPSDAFVGYDQDALTIAYATVVSVTGQFRAVRRALRARNLDKA